MSLLGLDDRLDRLLDAKIDDLITVIGEDYVNQVFANVCLLYTSDAADE